jgi:hypothetical protein
MLRYIDNLLLKFKHPCPLKPRLSPYTCLPISYGAKTQFSPEGDISALLDDAHKHRIQEIIGSLLYYARAVDNKRLVTLSTIAAKQSKATVATKQAVHLLLNYVATYPNDSIVYQASDMILCAHANAGFLNESQSCSCARAYIFLLENIRTRVSTGLYSSLPKSSSLSWHLLLNPSLLLSLSLHVR